MSRSDRRRQERELKNLEKKVQKIDENTAKLVERLATYKFDNYVKLFKDLISQATFQAMRENRVGEDRAYRIMDRINEIMVESTEDSKEERNELSKCS